MDVSQLRGSLIELSFIVANRLNEISAKEGRPVSIAGVHSISPSDDMSRAIIYLDIVPADVMCEAPGTMICSCDLNAVAGLDHDEILSVLCALGGDTRH
jgi:hypothetical protein